MPCNCSGLRKKLCNCKLVPKDLLANSESLVLVQTWNKEVEEYGPVYKLMEKLYDICASYNLRYCPLHHSSVRHDKSLKRAIKDIAVLVCFFFANFVVLLNITAKMVMHVYYVLKATTTSIIRPRLDADKPYANPRTCMNAFDPWMGQ